MIYLSTQERRKVTLCNMNYSPEGILHPDRIMDEYDLLYMIHGSWDIIEDSTHFLIHPGQLLILEPGHHHFSSLRCSPHMRNMYIHCTRLPKDGIKDTLALCLPKICDCINNPQIIRLYESMIETYWNRQDNHVDLRLSALLEVLLTELSVSDNQTVTQDAMIREILGLFSKNSDRFYSPETLAKSYGISSRTCNERFKNATGITIYQYQLGLKLQMAHELLPMNPHRGLRDIALSLGFYDEFQFSKLYKKKFGYPPSLDR